MEILQFSYAPSVRDALNFSCYVDLDQTSSVCPQKYQKFKAYPQVKLKVSSPPPQKKKKKNSNSVS